MNKVININNKPNYDIYISSFNNKEREEKLIQGLNETLLSAHIYSNTIDDERVDIIMNQINDPGLKRIFSVVFNLIKTIEDFYYNSKKEYGIFLENDVQFKKTIYLELPKVLNDMKRLNLDVLLIGCLLNCSPEQYDGCKLIENGYYQYPDNLWGAQGFILTKNHAKYFIEKYTVDYVLNHYKDENISPDWVFTKQGNRALIYPCLVIEEGSVDTTHEIHVNFHRACKNFLYNDTYTI